MKTLELLANAIGTLLLSLLVAVLIFVMIAEWLGSQPSALYEDTVFQQLARIQKQQTAILLLLCVIVIVSASSILRVLRSISRSAETLADIEAELRRQGDSRDHLRKQGR